MTGALYSTIGPLMKLRLPGWWPVFKWSADERYLAKMKLFEVQPVSIEGGDCLQRTSVFASASWGSR